MGTYTTNYNLFMPSVGETGWGTLVNGNFTTIDSTMKSLSNRITTVENEVNGALSCTSVTATTGTFSGAVTALTLNGLKIKSGVNTVSYSSDIVHVPGYSNGQQGVTLLPYIPGVTYTGKIKCKTSANNARYWNGLSSSGISMYNETEYTITNAHFVVVSTTTTGMSVYAPILL